MARILYFASLREQLDCASETLDVENIETLGALKQSLAERGGAWQAAFSSPVGLLSSINQQMATDGAAIANQDEIAFFPPVTGG
jgi:molybdopterin synthase sulfur carrier subunit